MVSAVALLVAIAAVGGWLLLDASPPSIPEQDVQGRPSQTAGGGYVTSDACRSCHPRQYETWRASYHQSMTAPVSPDSVIPSFDGVDVVARGRRYRLDRRGDEFWAEFEDPDGHGGSTEPSRIRRQVTLVTGSHHQQVFWYSTGQGRLLGQLPLTYLLTEGRWVPRRSVFLQPPSPNAPSETGYWNAFCIGCHTTNGRPSLDAPFGTALVEEMQADSRVSEFGIACEACHGPGAEHVRANRNPIRRYRIHLGTAVDATVIQPRRLDARASADVCGQCHSVWEYYDEAGERHENQHGVRYVPGGELAAWRFVAQPSHNLQSPTMQALLEDDPRFLTDSFWPDGMVSVSGREYNGLVDSPCYLRGNDEQGTLTCVSCHAMHQAPEDRRPSREWADDQLAPEMGGNEACLQCHPAIGVSVAAHTHHAVESSGSSCYNCHMPRTTYGLLKAIRSHQVSTPDVATTAATGRPNACNLCHLDRSLGWSAGHLVRWYGQPSPILAADEQSVAAGVLWMLSGDAQQRALVADAAGRVASQEASGTDWMPPYLGELLVDPYEAVRAIAARSLRSLPPYADMAYDFTGRAGDHVMARDAVLRTWEETGASPAPPVLVDMQGRLRRDTFDRLRRARNNRPVFLRE